MSSVRTDRLTQPVHPLLFELLYEPQLAADRHEVLPHLLRVDAAHVVMLARRGLLARAAAAQLLAVNRELTRRVEAGEDVLGAPARHRGLYFLYESTYIEKLGDVVGGAAHMGRSRNDINAAVTRLRLREELLAAAADAQELLGAMGRLAGAHLDTVLCGFTHQQPAQPTTLGHYLAGVMSELLRSAEWLEVAFGTVNCSPLGAAAGFGSSLRVAPVQVAELLGFGAVLENSADAVASRDYVVRVLSALAMLGITLTRLSADLQVWAGRGHGFVGWPDQLVSTSSIMPQKRNPFVLENIRGGCAEPVGALVASLMALKGAPFSNSVEVSQAATAPLWPALAASRGALRLTRLALETLEVFPARMLEFLGGSQATLASVAELLVSRHGFAFRSAHEALGRVARETAGFLTAPQLKASLEAILGETATAPVVIGEDELGRRLDPSACVRAAMYGGGPAPSAVRVQLRSLMRRVGVLRRRVDQRRAGLKAAAQRLRAATAELEQGARAVKEAVP